MDFRGERVVTNHLCIGGGGGWQSISSSRPARRARRLGHRASKANGRCRRAVCRHAGCRAFPACRACPDFLPLAGPLRAPSGPLDAVSGSARPIALRPCLQPCRRRHCCRTGMPRGCRAAGTRLAGFPPSSPRKRRAARITNPLQILEFQGSPAAPRPAMQPASQGDRAEPVRISRFTMTPARRRTCGGLRGCVPSRIITRYQRLTLGPSSLNRPRRASHEARRPVLRADAVRAGRRSFVGQPADHTHRIILLHLVSGMHEAVGPAPGIGEISNPSVLKSSLPTANPTPRRGGRWSKRSAGLPDRPG